MPFLTDSGPGALVWFKSSFLLGDVLSQDVNPFLEKRSGKGWTAPLVLLICKSRQVTAVGLGRVAMSNVTGQQRQWTGLPSRAERTASCLLRHGEQKKDKRQTNYEKSVSCSKGTKNEK